MFRIYVFFFFFNDTATTEIYTLSLHDALPISRETGCRGAPRSPGWRSAVRPRRRRAPRSRTSWPRRATRSGEHTSELQSRQYLVCRLLLGKKKKNSNHQNTSAAITRTELND